MRNFNRMKYYKASYISELTSFSSGKTNISNNQNNECLPSSAMLKKFSPLLDTVSDTELEAELTAA